MAIPEGEPLPRIPRGNEYWEEFEERTKRKRAMPRLDGEPALDVIEVVRDVNEQLMILGGYVGVGPRGSRWQGHALRRSDYDITILMDSSDPLFDRKMAHGITRDIRDVWAKQEKKINIHFDFVDMAGLSRDDDLSKFGAGHIAALAALGGDVVGPNIGRYRQIAHGKLLQLGAESRERVLRNAAELRLDQEGERSQTVQERVNGNTKKKYMPSLVRAGRTPGWHRKIFKAFDIPLENGETA